jgi:hypothetical protein
MFGYPRLMRAELGNMLLPWAAKLGEGTISAQRNLKTSERNGVNNL